MNGFAGFTLPDGAWLPPELIYIIPLLSESQLKCAVVGIYHYMQVGGAEPLSLSDFERLTGLSRQSVITALKALIGLQELKGGQIVQIFDRQAVGRTYVYAPRVKNFDHPKGLIVQNLDYHPPEQIVKNLDSSGTVKLRESDSELNQPDSVNSLSDSLKGQDGQKFLPLLKELRAIGVYLKTAQALVSEHSPEFLHKKLKHYRYALQIGFASSPGYYVQSVKEAWPAPLGYREPGADQRRYVSGSFSEFIEH